MGFLKFLKKGEDKKPENKDLYSEDLELPPPPQIGSPQPGLPSFPGPKFRADQQPRRVEIPPISLGLGPTTQKIDEIGELPEIKPLNFDQEKQIDIRPFQSQVFKETPIQPQIVEQPVSFPAEETSHNPPLYPKPENPEPKPPFIDEMPIYVRAAKFRKTMEHIDTMLKSQKPLESELLKIKRAKDEAYEAWSTSIEDVQRKLMTVDRMLFEVQK